MTLANVAIEKAHRVALLTIEVGRARVAVKEHEHALKNREKFLVANNPPRGEHDKNSDTRKAWVTNLPVNDEQWRTRNQLLHEAELNLMNLETALSAAGSFQQGVQFAIRSEGIEVLKHIYGFMGDHLDERLFEGVLDDLLDKALGGEIEYVQAPKTNIITDTASVAGPSKPTPAGITVFAADKFSVLPKKEEDREGFEAAISRQFDGGGFGGGTVVAPVVSGSSGGNPRPPVSTWSPGEDYGDEDIPF